jgi:hypothetical protein
VSWERKQLFDLIRSDQPFLRKTQVDGGMMGVVTTCIIHPKELILLYPGHLVPRLSVAHKFAEEIDPELVGSYIFCFNWALLDLCYDASETSGRLGRLVNHHHETEANVVMVVRELHGCPFLFLRAKRFIKANEELRYCYNDPDADRAAYPWLS